MDPSPLRSRELALGRRTRESSHSHFASDRIKMIDSISPSNITRSLIFYDNGVGRCIIKDGNPFLCLTTVPPTKNSACKRWSAITPISFTMVIHLVYEQPEADKASAFSYYPQWSNWIVNLIGLSKHRPLESSGCNPAGRSWDWTTLYRLSISDAAHV